MRASSERCRWMHHRSLEPCATTSTQRILESIGWGKAGIVLTLIRFRGQNRNLLIGGAEVLGERAAKRNPQRELAALAGLAVDKDVAAVLAENLAADRQAQAGPLGALGAEER